MRGSGRRAVEVRVELVAPLVALAVLALWLWSSVGAHAGETVTHTYTTTGGEQSFVVPVGITKIGVRAIGGTGKGGGAPSETVGDISVSPGETLYIEVGGSATNWMGGFNGGGEGGSGAGGGGGESDVRTLSSSGEEHESLRSRLIVAGGSGGESSTKKAGGAAGQEGFPEGEGGKPGLESHQGGSAIFDECVEGHERPGERIPSTAGKLGGGGRGESCDSKVHGRDGGGGGGAGKFGGGGGGAELVVEGGREWASGGGGGSSLVPEGGHWEWAEGAAPVIELTFARPESAPVVATDPATSVKALSATLNATVNPEDGASSTCEFEYGTSVFYEHTVPCATTPTGDQAVAVSAALEGLTGSTTYHYRIVATNGEGTSAGSDAEFTTRPHEPATVSEFTPTVGPDSGGTHVTFTGTELEHVTSVTFGGSPATGLELLSPTSLSVVTPMHGQGTVVLEDDLGDKTVAGFFSTRERPEIKKMSAKKGPSSGGTTVLLTGYFSGFAEPVEVLFGSVPGTVVANEAPFGRILVTTPAHSSGKFNVTVVTTGGPSIASKKAVFDFAGLEVTKVSPSSGPREGGTSLTVTGVGFAPGSGTTAFTVGKAAATGVECASTTQCTMTAPAAAKAGTVDVRATVVGGKGKTKKSPADHYTYE
jgi:hypothetical protein